MRRSEVPTVRRAAAIACAVLAAAGVAAAAPTFNPDDAPTGWVSRPALTNTDLRSGNEVIFRSSYRAGAWTGTVRANHINARGDILSTSPWTQYHTGAILDAMATPATSRRIVTRHLNGSGIPFQWNSLDVAQKAMIGTSTTGPAILGFVRGDRSNESPNGLKLRKRTSIQGDILHSSLVHWNHGNGVRRLYVGGNDGMLHVFDAATGGEVFAYVPSMLLSRLPLLSTTTYTRSLFVDGGLNVADVTLAGSSRTLLVGALGGGGRGLFMLDVTSPSPATEAAAAAMVKWEITPASPGFANLGYTYAVPRLTRLENGTAAVVVGNGYLNTGNGRASLFVIDADTGARICEIDTGSGSLASPNGLSSATLLDANNDGRPEFAYAGDIDGNLWRFDLRGSAAPACSATRLLATSPAQAITVAPVLARHPLGGQMVLFATGRVLTPADATSTAVHHAYGLWESAPVANTAWLEQVLTETTVNGQQLRTISAHAPNWASGGHRGWRLTLPAGERVIGEAPYLNDDRFYFTSTNPSVPAPDETQPSGETWLMEVAALTGGAPSTPVFDVNGDGRIDAADNVGGAVVAGTYLGGGVVSQAVLVDQGTVSQTLLNQQSDKDFTPPTPTTTGGVSGGHFDPDFYFTSGGRFSGVKHVHEYDDKYNVTGVNFLNASDASFNLGSKLANGVAFKVLLVNQYLNPAVSVTVGGSSYQPVRTYGGQTTATDAEPMLAQQPVFNLATVGTLGFKLPLDAFAARDWWGDGGTARAGLMPSKTSCVNGVSSTGASLTPGPNGEVHNGAFTVQIVKAATPASALELNFPGGGPKYGWRVKPSVFTSWVLAEYTVFWHHPNGKCYGFAGWVPGPPQDFSGSTRPSTPAANSDDPREGNFGSAPTGVTVAAVTTTVSGATTVMVISYSDGKTFRSEVTDLGNGTETFRVTDRNGTVSTGTRMSEDRPARGINERLRGSGRINWREVVRQ